MEILRFMIMINHFLMRMKRNKLSVLRDNYFRIDISEEQLGFTLGSHTLSHHLRGISFKALAVTDLDIERASNLIIGNLNGVTKKTIKNRIAGYLKNIRLKINSEKEDSLYTNLPKDYHKYLDSIIDNLKNS